MFIPSSPKRVTASDGGETKKKAFLHVNHASKPELISSLASYVQAEREKATAVYNYWISQRS